MGSRLLDVSIWRHRPGSPESVKAPESISSTPVHHRHQPFPPRVQTQHLHHQYRPHLQNNIPHNSYQHHHLGPFLQFANFELRATLSTVSLTKNSPADKTVANFSQLLLRPAHLEQISEGWDEGFHSELECSRWDRPRTSFSCLHSHHFAASSQAAPAWCLTAFASLKL